MKHIILVSGKMQSGKDTLAEFLMKDFQKLNMSVCVDFFAKDLKEWCKEDFQPIAKYLNGYTKKLKSLITVFYDLNFNDKGHLKNIINQIDQLKIKDENFFEHKTEITRLLLQIYGTDIFRSRVDTNWWAKRVKDRCKHMTDDVVIVKDVRFPNEIEIFFEELNQSEFKIIPIRVERSSRKTVNASHETEIALDNWSQWEYVVDNDGALNDLQNASKTIIEDILNIS
jgi:hypothetical protein